MFNRKKFILILSTIFIVTILLGFAMNRQEVKLNNSASSLISYNESAELKQYEGTYFYDALIWAEQTGYSTSNGIGSSITRQEVVTILWKFAGKPKAQNNYNYNDVNQNAEYYSAVNWATERGITRGTTDSTFSPYAPVNHAQLVTLLWRYAGSKESNTINNFTDVPESSYFANAVKWSVNAGIATGLTDTEFKPYDTINKELFLTYLYRYHNIILENSKNVDSSIPDSVYDLPHESTGIIVSISAQKLVYYEKGMVKLVSNVITGNPNNNTPTPTGYTYINYKDKYWVDKNGAYHLFPLNGKNYVSYVYYWMAFRGHSYGFHDAKTWRKESEFYDKDRYLYDGSHGCVNMPFEKAKALYNLVEVGTPVHIYE